MSIAPESVLPRERSRDVASESSWTDAELVAVRDVLEADRRCLRMAIDVAQYQLRSVTPETSGVDELDLAFQAAEREHELSMLDNSYVLLEQIGHALERLAEGRYPMCDECNRPVGKLRQQVFPRACTCLSCKQVQERH